MVSFEFESNICLRTKAFLDIIQVVQRLARSIANNDIRAASSNCVIRPKQKPFLLCQLYTEDWNIRSLAIHVKEPQKVFK